MTKRRELLLGGRFLEREPGELLFGLCLGCEECIPARLVTAPRRAAAHSDHDVRHVGFRSLYALARIAPFGRVALSPHPGATESVRWLVDTLGAHVEDLRRTHPSDEDWLEYEVAELEELRSRLSGLIEEGPRDRAAGPDGSSE